MKNILKSVNLSYTVTITELIASRFNNIRKYLLEIFYSMERRAKKIGCKRPIGAAKVSL